jgi:hypothetical protein
MLRSGEMVERSEASAETVKNFFGTTWHVFMAADVLTEVLSDDKAHATQTNASA